MFNGEALPAIGRNIISERLGGFAGIGNLCQARGACGVVV
jgi:hypothetical protein